MTNAKDYQRLHELFAAVFELPPAERDERLAHECGDDEELRAQVEALLAYHAQEGDALDATAPGVAAGTSSGFTGPVLERLTERPGDMVGRYKLLEQIGEGGFGVVYMAEQREPVARKVAVKIIKLGMDTRQVVARFEAERQALAMMSHPNIAKVLDGGVTDSGRPYFVMELVRGKPITDFCDGHRLDTIERLHLFQQVCHAVQHAHQKGLIHRDLKPSNVQVMMADDRPLPMVIDFGIAKATNARLTEQTLFTQFQQVIGTPEYMSPEQAGMSGIDVDTRSDVYSLGVLLYELLTGTTPFPSARLRSEPLGEIQRIIREQEPEKPSTRLSSLSESAAAEPSEGTSAAEVARLRQTDPHALTRLLRADLDWIVMRCLEKDRARRYGAASELAQDVERYLAHEPVVAGPPSAGYRLRKFLRRNRVPAAVAGAAAVLVVATIAVLSTSLLWVLRAESQSRREQAIAEAVSEFLREDILAAVAPSDETGRGPNVRMREVLDEAARRIDEASRPGGRFAEEPLVEASIRDTLADTFVQLGLYDVALPHAERAVQLWERWLGEDDQRTRLSMFRYAGILNSLNRHDEARDLFERVRTLEERALKQGHPDTGRVAQVLDGLAGVCVDEGRYDDAEALRLRALEHLEQLHGEEDERTIHVMLNLAVLYMDQQQNAEALAYGERALTLRRRVLGDDHRHTLRTIGTVASLYTDLARLDEAEALCLEAAEAASRVLGPEHPETLDAKRDLGRVYWHQERYAEAEPLFVEAFEGLKRVVGVQSRWTLNAAENLASLYGVQGRLDEAADLYRWSLEEQTRVNGRAHRNTISTMDQLANVRFQQGRMTEAEALYDEALALSRETLGEQHPSTLEPMHKLAFLYHKTGRGDLAEPMYREVLALRRELLGDEHPRTVRTMTRLSELLTDQGRHDQAIPLREEVVAARTELHGSDHADTLEAMLLLGQSHYKARRLDAAERLFVDVLEGCRRTAGDAARLVAAAAMHDLAQVLIDRRRYGEAEPLVREALARQRKLLGDDHVNTLMSMWSLARVFRGQGRLAEAQAQLEETLEAQQDALGKEHVRTLVSMHDLAQLYQRQRRFDEAKALYERAFEAQLRVLGEEHASTRVTMNNLGGLYRSLRKYDDAERLDRRTLELNKRLLGPEHRNTLGTMTNLALLLDAMGKVDEAERLFRTSVEAKRRRLGMSDPYTRIAISGYARLLERQERHDEALPLRRELLEYQLASAESPEAPARSLNEAAWALLTHDHAELRDATRALGLARRAAELSDHDDPGILDTLALALFETGDVDAAIETERRALELVPADAPDRDGYVAALERFESALAGPGGR